MHILVLIIEINILIIENEENKKKKPRKLQSKEVNKVSALDKSQINELLSESIQNYFVRLKKQSKETEESMTIIDNHVSEFLQAFVVFGYDMKGNPVCIQHALNQMDADALNSLINRVIFSGKGE
jgi:hypothetical protein